MSALHDGADMPPDAAVLLNGVIKQVCVVEAGPRLFPSDLNEIPNRIATLRMRSGVRFMMRAVCSKDFDALASSITRRSSAKDQDLPAIGGALL